MKRKTHFSAFLLTAMAASSCSSGSEQHETSTTGDDEVLITQDAEQGPASSTASLDSVDPEPLIGDPDLNPGSSTGDDAIAHDTEGDVWDIPNAGSEFAGPPLDPADGPDSADECTTARVEASAIERDDRCFFSADDPDTPAARIDQVVEVVDGERWVHLRLTLNPNFVDNSFGENAVGWGAGDAAEAVAPEMDPVDDAAEAPKGGKPKAGAAKPPKPGKMGHTFEQLVGSDHAEMKITNASGDVVLHFKIDYLSEDPDAPSGYSSLGVTGGEGKVLEGDASWIVAWTTSLDRNFNACGLDTYTENSPLPPSADSPQGEEPHWDYRVVYELWVSADAFGDDEFGGAFIEFVHASPSKGEQDSVDVVPGDCPPEDRPPADDDPPPSDDPPNDGAGGSPNAPDGGGGSAGESPTPAPVGIAR